MPPGGAIVWFLFPGRSYEVGAVYDAGATLLGYYTNFVEPPAPDWLEMAAPGAGAA